MPRRVLLAVSGTLQDGFELRGNLDHPEVPAVYIGEALVRGVRAFLDVKDAGCRECPGQPPVHARVNPACVVTADRRDANIYAVYLVDERVLLTSLLGEPRYLAMAPDCVRVDLQSSRTSAPVRELLRAAAKRLDPRREPTEGAILTVLSCFRAPSFVPLPRTETIDDMQDAAAHAQNGVDEETPMFPTPSDRRAEEEAAFAALVASHPHARVVRDRPVGPMSQAAQPTSAEAGAVPLTAGDALRASSFPEGLAAFAGVDVDRVRQAGIADGALRAAEAQLDSAAVAAARAVLGSEASTMTGAEADVGQNWYPRLSEAWDEATVQHLTFAAGFAEGSAGAELAQLARARESEGGDGIGAAASGDAAHVPSCLPPTKTKHVSIAARPSEVGCDLGRLALIMIDWQRDFLEVGGFGHVLGNDVTPLRRGLAPAAAVLQAARAAGLFVVHTVEAHEPDLTDCPPLKRRRCPAIGTILSADRGRILVRGEPGNMTVEEVAPISGELVLHKPGKGAFYSTDLEGALRRRGISYLLVTGVTTEVCVQTTLREANDRGFECVLVEDATESFFPEFKSSTIEMIVSQSGIVGCVADSATVTAALLASKNGTS